MLLLRSAEHLNADHISTLHSDGVLQTVSVQFSDRLESGNKCLENIPASGSYRGALLTSFLCRLLDDQFTILKC